MSKINSVVALEALDSRGNPTVEALVTTDDGHEGWAAVPSGAKVPIGSYWNLVFFNQWRVWWGPRWGVYYTLQTKEWSLLWPINAIAFLSTLYLLIKELFLRWRDQKSHIPNYHILTSWLLFYSLFLSLIGGWPHYMLLFLPFSNILLVKIIIDNQPIIMSKILSPKSQILNKFKILNKNIV